MRTAQERAWAGTLGDEYTARNRVDWRKRLPFWRKIMDSTGARSVLEAGCNAGWNLTAICQVAPRAEVRGFDVNALAVAQARTAGCNALIGTVDNQWELWLGQYELVFTAGTLIHVPPDALQPMMKRLIELSSQYVLAIEYRADFEEEPVVYRGQTDLLWRRPFGKLYENMGLKLLHTGVATGWDRATYWLLEKC